VFQHIIVPEVFNSIFSPVQKEIKNITVTSSNKPYFLIPNFSAFKGVIVEKPCPPDYSEGEFNALANAGNVMAEINGHDHFNNFTVNRQGVDIVSLSTAGWGGPNGIEPFRGAHVITLNTKNPGTYTNTLYTYAQAKKDGAALTETRPPQELWIVRVVFYLEVALHGIIELFR
jgi:hypothetical protein